MKIFIAMFMIMFINRSVLAQQTWSLAAVLDSIEKNNPALKQYQYQKKAQLEMASSVQSWDAPTVMAGLQEFPYGTGTMDSRKMVMLGAEQMLPNTKEQTAKAKYYESLGDLSGFDYSSNRRELFFIAKEAYFSWFIASKQLSVTEEQLKLIDVLIKMSEARIPYGKADLPSVYEARAKAADLQSVKLNQQALISRAKATLNYVLGYKNNTPFAIDSVQKLKNYDENLFLVSQDSIIQNRSDIARLGSQIKSIELNKMVIAGSKRTTFGLGWQNMRMNDGTYMTSLQASMILPSLSWAAKKYKAETRSADMEIEEIKYKQQDMLNQVKANINAGLADLASIYKAISLYQKQIIPAFKKNFDASLNSYGENTGNMNKVLMAWENLTAKKSIYWEKYGQALKLEANIENELEIK